MMRMFRCGQLQNRIVNVRASTLSAFHPCIPRRHLAVSAAAVPEALPALAADSVFQYVPSIFLSATCGFDPGMAAFLSGFLLRFMMLPAVAWIKRKDAACACEPLRTWRLEVEIEISRLKQLKFQQLERMHEHFSSAPHSLIDVEPLIEACIRRLRALTPLSSFELSVLPLCNVPAIVGFIMTAKVATLTNFYADVPFLWVGSLARPDPLCAISIFMVSLAAFRRLVFNPAIKPNNAAEEAALRHRGTKMANAAMLGSWLVAAFVVQAPTAVALHALGAVIGGYVNRFVTSRMFIPVPPEMTREDNPDLYVENDEWKAHYAALLEESSRPLEVNAKAFSYDSIVTDKSSATVGDSSVNKID